MDCRLPHDTNDTVIILSDVKNIAVKIVTKSDEKTREDESKLW